MTTKENDDTEDGEGQLQGQSEGGIYREEIRREVELSLHGHHRC